MAFKSKMDYEQEQQAHKEAEFRQLKADAAINRAEELKMRRKMRPLMRVWLSAIQIGARLLPMVTYIRRSKLRKLQAKSDRRVRAALVIQRVFWPIVRLRAQQSRKNALMVLRRHSVPLIHNWRMNREMRAINKIHTFLKTVKGIPVVRKREGRKRSTQSLTLCFFSLHRTFGRSSE